MAKLTWSWPFGYDDFAAAATETTWGFHDSAPTVLSIQFDAATSQWSATYWTPAEVAFNAAEAGVPPITGTAAITQAAASVVASGKEIFVGSVSVTQATAVVAASGKETFVGVMSVVQAAATVAASGKETFTGTVVVTQAVASVVASGTVLNPNRVGDAAITQAVATVAAAGSVVNPPPPPEPLPSARILPKWRPRPTRRIRPLPIRGTVAITQGAAGLEAEGEVRVFVLGNVAAVQNAAAMSAIGEVSDLDAALLLLIAAVEDEALV